MKATIIQVFDNEGNEIKNVSTEIVLNGETYVKKEADKQPDYSHLVGMWVKCTNQLNLPKQVAGKYYECVGIEETDGTIIILDDNGAKGSHGWWKPERHFDISNPLPYNPDTVVGLKELPNDGKTYAECLEDVVHMDALRNIKGLFYQMKDDESVYTEVHNGFKMLNINGGENFTNHFRIHTPAKPIWETCRETMWEYINILGIYVGGNNPANSGQDESLIKLTKHLNALAYLSEVARRCNGDRVVDWCSTLQRKYYIFRSDNQLRMDWTINLYKEISFLDELARDHSFEVDKHIWNDYYGLPNE